MLLLCLKPSCYISLLSFQSTPSIPCLCSSSVPAGHPGFFLVYLFLLLSVSGRIHLLLSASVFFSALFLNTLLCFCCIYCYHLIFYCSHHSLSSYPKDCHVRSHRLHIGCISHILYIPPPPFFWVRFQSCLVLADTYALLSASFSLPSSPIRRVLIIQ